MARIGAGQCWLPDGRVEVATPPDPRTGAGALVLDPLEFVHAVVTQIPDARKHLVRYYGAYRQSLAWEAACSCRDGARDGAGGVGRSGPVAARLGLSGATRACSPRGAWLARGASALRLGAGPQEGLRGGPAALPSVQDRAAGGGLDHGPGRDRPPTRAPPAGRARVALRRARAASARLRAQATRCAAHTPVTGAIGTTTVGEAVCAGANVDGLRGGARGGGGLSKAPSPPSGRASRMPERPGRPPGGGEREGDGLGWASAGDETPGRRYNSLCVTWCALRESNPYPWLRRPVHYPLC